MREHKGLDLSAFSGNQRHVVESINTMLYELSAGMKNLGGGRQPTASARYIILPGGGTLSDGDYGDIAVRGGQWTVESYGGVQVIPAGTDLQPIVNSLSAGAHILQLEEGTYYGDSSSPSTPLTLPNTLGDMLIVGEGWNYTKIKSPVLMQAGNQSLHNLWVIPNDTAYGVKIYNGGSPFIARNNFRRTRIGGTSLAAADGPFIGLQGDGCGAITCEQCLFAFCQSDGVLLDSTGTEPNTCWKFDMCSAVGNGAWGYNLKGSLSICELHSGSAQDNVSGDLSAVSMNHLALRSVDFERHTPSANITQMLVIQNCNPTIIDGCNFDMTDATADRAIFIQGGSGHRVHNNRFSGWGSVGIIRVSEDATDVSVSNNVWPTDFGYPYIEDYSR